MSDLTLSQDELRALTGYRRGAEQLAKLREMGIKAHRRRDGSIAVARVWLAAAAESTPKSEPRIKRRAAHA